MRKLLVYMKDYRKEAVLAPLFKLLEACFDLMVPLVVAGIIDVGIREGDAGYIVRMSLLMAGLGVAGLLFSVTAQYFSAKAASGFTAKVRAETFAHIQALSFTELDDIGTSSLITRMTSDMNQVQSGVNLFLRLFLRSPFIVVGAMVMAFTIDVRSAIVFAVVIPVLCLVVFGIMLIGIPLYARVQERLDKITLSARENLTGVRVIRAFCREKDEEKSFREENSLLVKIQLFSGRISSLMNPLTYLIINAGLIVLLYIGAQRVDSGFLLQGSVVALVNYMAQILTELIKFADLIITMTKAVACGNRIESVLEVPAGMEDGREMKKEENSGLPQKEKKGEDPDGAHKNDAVAQDAAVEFDHVSFRYRGAAEPALTDITFTVTCGQTVGIIGGTGSGKTSLISLIPRFYDAEEGSVIVEGRDVIDYPVKDLRGKVGIVMQKSVLFKGTIRSNLLWGNEGASDEDLLLALAAAQALDILVPGCKQEDMEEKKEDLIRALDAPVEQEGRNFSGGQRQRLTIARALVRDPEILILDDSASALDFATDLSLRRAIRALSCAPRPGRKPMTVFIVSQRTSSICEADQILVLDDGRMVGHGTHEELLKTCDVYRETHLIQFPEAGKEDA